MRHLSLLHRRVAVWTLAASPILAACASSTTGAQDAARPTVTLVSLQGASLTRVRALVQQGRMPAIARLAETGSGLAETVPVDAPATATARATFETGASPTAHGIVANTFHRRGDAIDTVRSGFNTVFGTEPIYDAAARQGRSVATIGIALRAGLSTSGRAAWATAGRILRPARVAVLTRARPVDTSRVVVQGDTTIVLLRLADGGVSASIRLAGGQEASSPLGVRSWVPIWLSAQTPRAGAWVKTLAISASGDSARLYVGNTVATDASPASLTSELEARVGPAPSTPDWGNHAEGLIDDATWREQVIREAEYLTVAAEHVRATVRPELLVVAFNLLDAHEHQFQRSHPRHPTFGRSTAADQARWRAAIDSAYVLADALVARVTAGSTTAIVASEYALLPVHSRFQLAAALRQLGYSVSGPSVEVRVMASSASAHVRLNARNRERTGVVADTNSAVALLESRLRDLRDPTTNEPVLHRIETVATMRQRGEVADVFGDIRVIARPGYALGDLATASSIVDTPFLPGEHAFDPALSETHGIFVAHVRGVGPARLTQVGAADVAVAAARLLGIEPPRGATGRSPF